MCAKTKTVLEVNLVAIENKQSKSLVSSAPLIKMLAAEVKK